VTAISGQISAWSYLRCRSQDQSDVAEPLRSEADEVTYGRTYSGARPHMGDLGLHPDGDHREFIGPVSGLWRFSGEG
jgi:hypothetical protein